MFLRLTFLNDEKHDYDFFGEIFSSTKASERPLRGETLISTTNEKYLVKDILVKTEEIEWGGRKENGNVWDYQLEKITDNNSEDLIQLTD